MGSWVGGWLVGWVAGWAGGLSDRYLGGWVAWRASNVKERWADVCEREAVETLAFAVMPRRTRGWACEWA